MIPRRWPRIVLLANLEDHSAREACLGAAQYAASAHLVLEPWSLTTRNLKASDLRDVDGLILTVQAHQKIFGARAKARMPQVIILSPSPARTIASVELQEGEVGRLAAEHLLHRQYPNLVAIGPRLEWSSLRIEGFMRECRRRKVHAVRRELPESILPVYWQGRSLRGSDKLRRILSGLPRPCGIFAVNDVAACVVIEAARAVGLRVPREFGVIGADNDLIPHAAAGLSISSVEPPFRALGFEAASLLHRLQLGQVKATRVMLPPVRVIVRTSTDVFMVGDPIVRRAQAFIEARRGGAVRVAEVARAIGTTGVTLGKRFREHLGMVPMEYILGRRIEFARELLREGKQQVTEISGVCGFHSASYFCHVFRQVTGVTPSSLRRRA